MRCDFRRANCDPTPPNTACFKCVHCRKSVLVVKALAPRIEEFVQSFPDCSARHVEQLQAPADAPAAPAPVPPPVPPAQPYPYQWDPAGAGTQLKKLLAKVGITSTENCSCNARAKLMNERGIEWCEQNVNEIVGWLKEEAAKRKLPFLSLPAKIVVQRAIKIAKKVREAQAASADVAAAEAAAESSTAA